MDVVYELQAGSHMVPEAEAHGAAVLRHLDVEKFRSFLKRKWQDEKGQPHDALDHVGEGQGGEPGLPPEAEAQIGAPPPHL